MSAQQNLEKNVDFWCKIGIYCENERAKICAPFQNLRMLIKMKNDANDSASVIGDTCTTVTN